MWWGIPGFPDRYGTRHQNVAPSVACTWLLYKQRVIKTAQRREKCVWNFHEKINFSLMVCEHFGRRRVLKRDSESQTRLEAVAIKKKRDERPENSVIIYYLQSAPQRKTLIAEIQISYEQHQTIYVFPGSCLCLAKRKLRLDLNIRPVRICSKIALNHFICVYMCKNKFKYSDIYSINL